MSDPVMTEDAAEIDALVGAVDYDSSADPFGETD